MFSPNFGLAYGFGQIPNRLNPSIPSCVWIALLMMISLICLLRPPPWPYPLRTDVSWGLSWVISVGCSISVVLRLGWKGCFLEAIGRTLLCSGWVCPFSALFLSFLARNFFYLIVEWRKYMVAEDPAPQMSKPKPEGFKLSQPEGSKLVVENPPFDVGLVSYRKSKSEEKFKNGAINREKPLVLQGRVQDEFTVLKQSLRWPQSSSISWCLRKSV